MTEKAKGPQKKGLSYKEEIEFKKMESVIQAKEMELQKTQKLINDPETQADSQKINEYYSKIGFLEKEIESLYHRWSELESKSVV